MARSSAGTARFARYRLGRKRWRRRPCPPPAQRDAGTLFTMDECAGPEFSGRSSNRAARRTAPPCLVRPRSDYWMPAFAGMTTERIKSSFAGWDLRTLVLLGRRGQHAGHHDDKRNREPDQIGMKHKA